MLPKYLGIGGLALATSIAAIVGTLLLFITLRKKIGGFGLKEISKSFVKISVASVLMGFIALGSFNFFSQSMRENIALILAIVLGALAYAILINFMRVREVDRSIEAMKKKVKVVLGSGEKSRSKEISDPRCLTLGHLGSISWAMLVIV